MNFHERLEAFSKLGSYLYNLENNSNKFVKELYDLTTKTHLTNGWFIEKNVRNSITEIALLLDKEKLANWVKPYSFNCNKKIGVVLAGNIPLVGFHDFLSILISGNTFIGKLSSKDDKLLPKIADILIDIEPSFESYIEFTENPLRDVDAMIGTGSNNTSRYLEYYFKKYPNIIRRNRNSVAVLDGNESDIELENLCEDIFSYFGLGCRNISKVYIPDGYDLDKIFKASLKYSDIKDNNKYINNFEYHRAIYLLDNIDFYENGFFILKPDAGIPSPVATLHYQHYNSIEEVVNEINLDKDKIQCIASNCDIPKSIPLGTVQKPKLEDYADGIDTMNFLSSLS